MRVPDGVIIPLYLASFVMLAIQYLRVDPVRRVVNLRFGLMVGAVVLIFASVGLADRSLSLVFFLLALFWFGLTLYLFRFLPPPRH
jgi:TctA family transporter